MNDKEIFDLLLKLISIDTPPVDLSHMGKRDLYRTLGIARIHGILGMILIKYNYQPTPHAYIWDIAHRDWQSQIAQSMRIRFFSLKAISAFKKMGIPMALIKGIDFADTFYEKPSARAINDVDILIPKEFWNPAAGVLDFLGCYSRSSLYRPTSGGDLWGQKNWYISNGKRNIEVDMQWNFINEPYFRSSASVEYWDLDWQDGKATPATRLIIAAVHALHHHQFNRLYLLSDLQRAYYKLSESDKDETLRIARRTHLSIPLDISLHITSQYLDDPSIEIFRKKLTKWLNLPTYPSDILQQIDLSIRSINPEHPRRRIQSWLRHLPHKPSPGKEFSELTFG